MTKIEASTAFARADDAWGDALARTFGRDACNQRYLPAGKGDAGTELRHLHDKREAARATWERACGLATPAGR